jgi:hypothetical protein
MHFFHTFLTRQKRRLNGSCSTWRELSFRVQISIDIFYEPKFLQTEKSCFLKTHKTSPSPATQFNLNHRDNIRPHLEINKFEIHDKEVEAKKCFVCIP